MIFQSRNGKSIAGKNPDVTAPRPDTAGESAIPLLQPDSGDDNP